MSLLVLEGVQKQFGARRLFDIDTLTIDHSTAYALTGANGTGKSTLLRLLAGLEKAAVQHCRFEGRDVSLQPYPREMREAIIYVHQHPVMFATSVAGNIAYGLRMRGLPAATIHKRVEEAMTWAGLLHVRDADPRLLSGGEKQRVALARAKVLDPRLLLLDEPTSSLDGPAREQVIALVPELARQGCSVILACHDRDLISLRAIQRLKIKGGRLHWLTPPSGESQTGGMSMREA